MRRLEAAVAQKTSNVADLIIVVEAVMTMTGNQERHLLSIEFDLEVLFFCLFCDSAEPLKHLDDIPPWDVVRRWMSEDLLQRLLCVWHGSRISNLVAPHTHGCSLDVVHSKEILMSSVVFLRAVNVGGHKSFRPTVLAEQLAKLDVVSIGAAGTFVVRSAASESEIHAAFARKLPVETTMMIATAKQVVTLLAKAPFGRRSVTKGDGDYITIVETPLSDALVCPIRLPEGATWQVQIVEIRGAFVACVRRKSTGTQFYPNELVERHFGVAATTRGWPTFMKIQQVLER